MTKILRVFPHKNSYTPDDDMTAIGFPPLPDFIPKHDEVHISCVFSWDKEYCHELKYQWQGATEKPVLLGGPAFGSPATDFNQGMYLKHNITFTSRGCNNGCSWCCVPSLEGKLKELPITAGNIIQDNNFLQTSKSHKHKVFAMLKTQKAICFKGGLQADLISREFIDDINSLFYSKGTQRFSRIAELWLACDTDDALPRFKAAMEALKATGFRRDKIKCYVLLMGRDMAKDEARLREVYEAGAMPFAQLYQPIGIERKKIYPKEWERFARMWQRPAATEAHMKKNTDFSDY